MSLETDKLSYRKWIVRGLPEPITPASEHLQIFENYIPGTDLRLKSERWPHTDERQKMIERIESKGRTISVSRFLLSADEYSALAGLKGREIRKNRYFVLSADIEFSYDVYLGPLWGLNTATAYLPYGVELPTGLEPRGAILEISDDPDLIGRNLVDLDFEDLRSKFAK